MTVMIDLLRRKFLLSLSLLILLYVTLTLSAEAKEKYDNELVSTSILSVQLYSGDDPLTMPIMQLGTDEYLTLKFDDLGNDAANYRYTILHCDANWNESNLMQTEYLEGFFDNPLDDYALSFNTTINYTNYILELPNNNIKFRYSGNYVLIVYEGTDRCNVVFTRRFYVVEPKVEIDGRVKRATFDAYQGDNQEVDFNIRFAGFKLSNPLTEVSVVLMKNRRSDSAIRNLKPRSFNNGLLDYNYDEENVFSGGNEYRFFDIRSWRYVGEGVKSIEKVQGKTQVSLHPSELRSNKRYFYYAEMNGNYRVESQDRNVKDFDTECDYAFVHFTLDMPSPLLGGTVNVFGALTNYDTSGKYAMQWNFQQKRYELSLLLKQGYYNYEYVYIADDETIADETVIEGTSYETENDYQIFVYYRKQNSGRYDRLVGIKQLNSLAR